MGEKDSGNVWLGWLIVFIGAAFLWSNLEMGGTTVYFDFFRPLGEAIALSPFWWIFWRIAEIAILTLWPVIVIYYGAKFILKK